MGAIGLFAPAFRVNEKREIELLAALSEAAENINKQF
jgi:DNA-binding IclR family transcriptional regulator